jgi:hypothetical protein
MHIGNGATPSKIEAMYFTPPRRLLSDANTSRLDVLDYLESPVDFIDFTMEFKSLGSIADFFVDLLRSPTGDQQLRCFLQWSLCGSI